MDYLWKPPIHLFHTTRITSKGGRFNVCIIIWLDLSQTFMVYKNSLKVGLHKDPL